MLNLIAALMVAQSPNFELGRPCADCPPPVGFVLAAPRFVLAQPSFAFAEVQPPRIYRNRLERLWPHEALPLFPNLRIFKGTRWAQRRVVLNDAPFHAWVGRGDGFLLQRNGVRMHLSGEQDPNTLPEWSAPGGLVGVGGWESVTAAYVPAKVKIRVVQQSIPRSSTLVSKRTWVYPAGTQFVEVLAKDGKPFEVRTMEKSATGRWQFRVPFREPANAPKGYKSMMSGSACADCHRNAGEQQQYGTGIRGGDGVFSFNPDGEHRDMHEGPKVEARNVGPKPQARAATKVVCLT